MLGRGWLERQKATRKLRKLQREAASQAGGAPSEELLKSIGEAEVDVKYTAHFPPGERYIALFRDPGAGTPAARRRDAIRAEIARKTGGGGGGDDWGGDVEEEEGGDGEKEAGDGSEYEKTKTTGKKQKKRGKERETPSAKKTKKKGREEQKQEETRIENDDFFEF